MALAPLIGGKSLADSASLESDTSGGAGGSGQGRSASLQKLTGPVNPAWVSVLMQWCVYSVLEQGSSAMSARERFSVCLHAVASSTWEVVHGPGYDCPLEQLTTLSMEAQRLMTAVRLCSRLRCVQSSVTPLPGQLRDLQWLWRRSRECSWRSAFLDNVPRVWSTLTGTMMQAAIRCWIASLGNHWLFEVACIVNCSVSARSLQSGFMFSRVEIDMDGNPWEGDTPLVQQLSIKMYPRFQPPMTRTQWKYHDQSPQEMAWNDTPVASTAFVSDQDLEWCLDEGLVVYNVVAMYSEDSQW
jgi:hypothetical protein